MKRQNIAGMSTKGGRKDNFYFCLLEFFPEADRWFLHGILKVSDEETVGGDEAIRSWIENYELSQMVVDFPLSSPLCETCVLDCPGLKRCPELNVKAVQSKIFELLKADFNYQQKDPKEYERKRNQADEFVFDKDVLAKATQDHLLSRSFKRRLKKGYLPYWNRPIDVWVWIHYYDQLLHLFSNSYDSFGNNSLMMMFRFNYLKKHFPQRLMLFEGNVSISLIEMLRSGILKRDHLSDLNDIDMGVDARRNILESIEEKLNIFVYNHDQEILISNQRAFQSFILAMSGKNIIKGHGKKLPDWALPQECRFIVPEFERELPKEFR